jgi:hypothetical protein
MVEDGSESPMSSVPSADNEMGPNCEENRSNAPPDSVEEKVYPLPEAAATILLPSAEQVM